MGVGIKLKSMSVSVRSWRCTYTSFASKASLYCRKGTPQKGKSELCSNVSHDRCICMAPYIFQLFFQPVVCWLWCHPTICWKDKGIEWRLLHNVSQNYSFYIKKSFLSTASDTTLRSLSCRVYISPTQSVIQI